jgi:hypothetical protein
MDDRQQGMVQNGLSKISTLDGFTIKKAVSKSELRGVRRSWLDAHHVNYRRIFDVEISDLLSVCRKCHDDIHKAFETPRREKPKHLSLTNAGPYKYRIPGDTLSRALLLIFGGQCFSCGKELSDNTVRRISFRKKTNRRHKGIPVCRMCADTALSEAQEQAAREILSNADWDSAWKSVAP